MEHTDHTKRIHGISLKADEEFALLCLSCVISCGSVVASFQLSPSSQAHVLRAPRAWPVVNDAKTTPERAFHRRMTTGNGLAAQFTVSTVCSPIFSAAGNLPPVTAKTTPFLSAGSPRGGSRPRTRQVPSMKPAAETGRDQQEHDDIDERNQVQSISSSRPTTVSVLDGRVQQAKD